MNTPIEDYGHLLGLIGEGPPEQKEFFKKVYDYASACRDLFSDLKESEKVNKEEVLAILNIVSDLDTIIPQFSEIIKEYIESKNIKDEKITGKEGVEEDLLNYMQFLRTTIESSFNGTVERLSYPRIACISQYLTTAFNSLIGICLINAWEKSRGERDTWEKSFTGRRCIKSSEYYCEPEIFYKALYDSSRHHAGIFKRQLFLITRGKIQQAYIPFVQEGERPVQVEKAKMDDILSYETDSDDFSPEELDEDEEV